MHFNLQPLKLYRANRVMDFGDGWLTRIGEVLLLPDVQKVRDLEKLGAVEEVRNERLFATEITPCTRVATRKRWVQAEGADKGGVQELLQRKGWFARWLEKFIRR